MLIGCHGGLEETGGWRSAQSLWIRRDVVTAKKGRGLGDLGGRAGRRVKVKVKMRTRMRREDQEIYAVKKCCGRTKNGGQSLRLSCAGTGTKEGTWYSPLARLAAGGWQLALSVAPSSTTGLAWSWSWSWSRSWSIASVLCFALL